jgi:hypothetical protein
MKNEQKTEDEEHPHVMTMDEMHMHVTKNNLWESIPRPLLDAFN